MAADYFTHNSLALTLGEGCLAYAAAGVTHLALKFGFDDVDRFIEDLQQVGEEVISANPGYIPASAIDCTRDRCADFADANAANPPPPRSATVSI